ncbi:MAG: UDP-3-O-(3-hydroxymyristoyl)glucosamine N-acyltransferase [Gammaproteobacteria bacterium]|nr:UDP-3-O-(3-hydroxymyristoyl)glucosamine N-acyltransferase [Gammaproteobacteria bacterium]
MAAITLADLAIRYGCELRGDPDLEVSCVGTLDSAESGAISFLANSAYRAKLTSVKATAVILAEEDADDCPVACLVTPNPYAAYAAVATELYPARKPKPGVHPSVVCDPGTSIPASAEVGPGVVLGSKVQLGERTYIGPNTVIGDNVSVGDDGWLAANVSIASGTRIGKRCLLHSGAVVGSDGFGIAQSDSGWIKVPQVGGVAIGDDFEMGANSTIDRGAIEDTCIGDDVKLDNMVQIAHNVIIGDHTAFAALAGVGGSAKIGARCMIGGQAGVLGHLEVCDDVFIHAHSLVTKGIREPGTYSSAWGVEEASKWRRLVGHFKRLEVIAEKIKAFQKTLKDIKK